MPYDYQTERPNVFLEENQRAFLNVRDRCRNRDRITMGDAIMFTTGSSWAAMAFVDRLVELGELREIDAGKAECAQERVFTWVGR